MHIEHDFQIIKNVSVPSKKNNTKQVLYLNFSVFISEHFFCYLFRKVSKNLKHIKILEFLFS